MKGITLLIASPRFGNFEQIVTVQDPGIDTNFCAVNPVTDGTPNDFLVDTDGTDPTSVASKGRVTILVVSALQTSWIRWLQDINVVELKYTVARSRGRHPDLEDSEVEKRETGVLLKFR